MNTGAQDSFGGGGGQQRHLSEDVEVGGHKNISAIHC